MKLRWEKRQDETWWAYSGRIPIGRVVERDDHTIGYTITGVPIKWIGKGYGDVSSISSGKRAIERGWRQWLTAAGLAHPLQNSWHTFRQSVNPAKATVTFTFNTSEELDRALNDLGSAAKWEHVE